MGIKERIKLKGRMEWVMGICLLLSGILLSLMILPAIAGNKRIQASGDRSEGSFPEYMEDDGESGNGDGKTDGSTDGSGALGGVRIVVDPGHGGIDPGKVGVHQELEKDINLQIALKLGALLAAEGAEVVYTRTEDAGLYSESDSNKKAADLKQRCLFIAHENPDISVSIHQNSYTSESISGAQVFYYEGSEEGKLLASEIQKALIEIADPDNKRVEKSNNSYYMLVHSASTAVIVECGFLSNSEEASKLSEDDYQQTIAEAIMAGIRNYFQNTDSSN